MLSILQFFRESIEEVTQKVSWPSQEKVEEMGSYFLVGVLISTAIVVSINIGFDRLLQWVYSYFK